MKLNRSIDEGMIFGSWKIIAYKAKEKHWSSLCQCTVCGTIKTIARTSLRNNTFQICSRECIKQVLNLYTIKKHWNCELNAEELDFNSISYDKKFWFRCNKGHNFKSNIKGFSLDKCPKCNKKLLNNPKLLYGVREYYKKVLSAIGFNPLLANNVLSIPIVGLYFKEFNSLILFEEKNKRLSYSNYFTSESSYLSYIDTLYALEKELNALGGQLYIVNTENFISQNVEQISAILKSMLKLE